MPLFSEVLNFIFFRYEYITGVAEEIRKVKRELCVYLGSDREEEQQDANGLK